jgi:hypothetical protein
MGFETANLADPGQAGKPEARERTDARPARVGANEPAPPRLMLAMGDEPVKISWSEAYRRLHDAMQRRESRG